MERLLVNVIIILGNQNITAVVTRSHRRILAKLDIECMRRVVIRQPIGGREGHLPIIVNRSSRTLTPAGIILSSRSSIVTRSQSTGAQIANYDIIIRTLSIATDINGKLSISDNRHAHRSTVTVLCRRLTLQPWRDLQKTRAVPVGPPSE